MNSLVLALLLHSTVSPGGSLSHAPESMPGLALTQEHPGLDVGVPKDFVMRLLRRRAAIPGGRDLDLRVGEIPKGFETFVPKEAAVVGGVADRKTALLLLDIDLPLYEVRPIFLELMANSEFSLRQPEGVGFLESSEGFPVVFCNGKEEALTVRGLEISEGLTELSVELSRSYPAIKSCLPSVPGSTRSIPIPRLVCPPGVEVNPSGSSSGGGSVNRTVRLKTTKSPSELLAHLGREMEDQGWQAGVPMDFDGFAFQSFTTYIEDLETATAVAWFAILTLRTDGQEGGDGRFGRISVERAGVVDR